MIILSLYGIFQNSSHFMMKLGVFLLMGLLSYFLINYKRMVCMLQNITYGNVNDLFLFPELWYWTKGKLLNLMHHLSY